MFPTFRNPDLNEKKFNDPCKLFYRMFRNLYKIHGNQAIGLLDFRVRKNDGRDRLVPSGAIGNNLFEVGAEQRWEPLCKRTLDQSNLLTPPTLTLAQLLKIPFRSLGPPPKTCLSLPTPTGTFPLPRPSLRSHQLTWPTWVDCEAASSPQTNRMR